MVRCLGLRGLGGLALALCLCAPVIADRGTEFDGYRATVTMEVPFLIDDTEAMQAREHLFPPVEQLTVVPNVLNLFPQRRGPRFVGQNDLISELFGNGYFPGPSQSGLTPGDPNVAVGPSHVVGVINGRLTFHTKAGSTTANLNPTNFFSGLGISFSLVFDPRCFYDQYSGRFFIMYGGLENGANRSYYLVAVSDDSDPNGTWAKWALNATLNGNTDSGTWADYPGFGYDQNVVMFTSNQFPFSGGGGYGKIRVCPKQQFLNGSPTITYTDFWNFSNPSGGTAWSLQPGRHLGTSNLPYVVNVSGGNRLNIFAIQNPLGTPTLAKVGKAITSYGTAASAVQKGTSTLIDTLDTRIYDVCVRDNQVLVTHNISGGAGARVRWYVANAAAMPSNFTVAQTGNIEDANAYIYYGALQMNQYGTIGTGVTKSSSTEYVSLYYTGRLSTDPVNTMRPLTLKRAATVGYNGEANPCRWGDYIGGAVDPADDTTFWAIGMVPVSSGSWGTEIYSYSLDPTTGPLSGKITLLNYLASPAGFTANLEFRSPGTTTVLYSYPITLDSSGNYSLPNVALGTFDVAVKFSHWLRNLQGSVVIVPSGNTVNLTLVNGDCNDDNSVSLPDLNYILTVFGGNAFMGDLDGSGVVDLGDLNLVLTNFGLAGSP